MLFKDVVGQQNAKAGLLSMWHNGSFPHALMIAGNEGTGGLPMALALAQYILCEDKNEDDACGKCPNCSKCERMEHADLHYSFPSFPPKPNTPSKSVYFIKQFRELVKQSPYSTVYDWLQFINPEKQGKISADEANDIIDTLNLRSYEGGKKIQIIWRPEYLFKEGNKLLKLIEEPPSDTILILVAEDPEDVLATIRSRTQMIKLAPIPAGTIAEYLVTRSLTDPAKAAQVGHIAMGSYTEALRLLKHMDNDLLADVKKLFTAIYTKGGQGNGIEISKFVEEWSKKGREQQKNFLYYVIHLIEQAIKIRYVPAMQQSLQTLEAQFATNLAGRNVSFEGLGKMVAIINDTISCIERNAHSKTQLHAMAIRMRYVVSGVKDEVFG